MATPDWLPDSSPDPLVPNALEPSTAIATAAQMRAIEERIFAAGMPVAALMEKVGGAIARQLRRDYPTVRSWGVLVGPGHNGGDALVVARELHLAGDRVILHHPFDRRKPLTDAHWRYAVSLGLAIAPTIDGALAADPEVWIDGLFGFGLERAIAGDFLLTIFERLNGDGRPVVAIDLPSGLHTDSGQVLGMALRAERTYCLGLWKRGLLQDAALPWCGAAQLIEFGIPAADLRAVLGDMPDLVRVAPDAIAYPTARSPLTHKYQQGHGLLVVGSRAYPGAAILAGLGALGSGVGLLSLAVPEPLQLPLLNHLPEAIAHPCPVDAQGAIADLSALDLSRYDAIAVGCGLSTAAVEPVMALVASDRPLILDADALTILARRDAVELLQTRSAPTVLLPHGGEFARLFPDLDPQGDRLTAAAIAAQRSRAITLLKGARTAIASPTGRTWIVADSTPALARGGSGDVLAGLVAGRLATRFRQGRDDLTPDAIAATVAHCAAWHAQAARLAERDRTALGVSARTVADYLAIAAQRPSL
ncbi:MAG: NAD(P)H-hydrate dehydratase [Cyanophyceae cyanobacterium]